MKSLTTSVALLNSMTKVPAGDTTTTTLLTDLWNDSIKTICSIRSGKWWFLQTTTDIATEPSQQGYATPAGVRKLVDIFVTVGTAIYRPQPIYSPEAWNAILSAKLGESDVPQFYFVQGNKVLIEPIPASNSLSYDAQSGDFTVGLTITGGTSGATAVIESDDDSGTTGTLSLSSITGLFVNNETITDGSSGSATTNGVLANVITFRGRKNVPDLTVADLTTPTITSITNGTTAIVINAGGLASMAGKYIRITNTGVDNTGDGQWYEIASATATTITLVAPYEGTTIAAGTAACVIAQMSPIPEAYDMAPIYRTLALFYQVNAPESPRIYNTYWKLYDGGQEAGLSTLVGGLIGQMLESEGESIEGAYVPPIGSTDSLAYGALWYEPRQDASGF